MAFARRHSGGGPHQQFQHAEFAGLQSSSPHASSSRRSDAAHSTPNNANPHRIDDMQFDIFEWYPSHQSCLRYFLDHAQHSAPVQAVAAFINISLPFQNQPTPVVSFARGSNTTPRGPFPDSSSSSSTSRPTPAAASSSSPPIPIFSFPSSSSSALPTSSSSVAAAAAAAAGGAPNTAQTSHVSLIPYLRRLVVTGLDLPGVLHGFFGDDWAQGVGPLHEQERRNYLFSAKSGGWASVKKDYDILPLETVPFLRPLRAPTDGEISAAEKSWSEWLAMEDWMVGPRAPPETMDEGGGGGGGGGQQQGHGHGQHQHRRSRQARE